MMAELLHPLPAAAELGIGGAQGLFAVDARLAAHVYQGKEQVSKLDGNGGRALGLCQVL